MRLRSWKTTLTIGAILALATSAAVGSGESDEQVLPFDLPSAEVLQASDRKVFAHYFTQFRISIDNRPAESDYYTRNYLNPEGEGGIHAAYGGFLRDRPLPREPLSGNWELTDKVTEVTRAHEAGLDGFTLDMLSINRSSYHWRAMNDLLTAAPMVDDGFDIVLMPDMNAGTIRRTDAAGLAAAVAELAAYDAVYRLDDGRLVVAPFKASNRSPQWWSEFMSIMADEHGEEVAFVPMFLNLHDVKHGGLSNLDAYKSISYGMSEGSHGAPAGQASIPSEIARVQDAGLIFMPTLAPQDTRPNQGNYYEANNTENFRAGWEAAISGGADWVQLMTWNDYSENHQVSPSVASDGVWLDLASYYLTWFKTGQPPEIQRDTLYLTHRKQFAHARPTSGPQTKFQTVRRNGGTPRDTVEVLTFLTDNAVVDVSIGGSPYDYPAPAGVNAELFELDYGFHSAVVTRDGTETVAVSSPWEVTDDFVSQDLLYWATKDSDASGGNPYTPEEACGSGYSVINSHALTGGRIYLLHNSSSGYKCVVTMKASNVGTPSAMSASLQVQGETKATDPGNFSYYAGPVEKHAHGTCVKWGGSIGSSSWESPYQHCE
ncbi:endo-1,3-alpha-glucanase family glycosylhydrolase [Microbulbifer rhizosphaerae]|uniref:Glycosyl hydrolase family 71 n=1 Tax=Microbulbifer rhizosphaerae TaxID=1562603 RepID=A0A7W4WCI9_9GAMM|nr:endo-1,3-alpha-glucanase family glycosylhydrolase [Microbulbifer rhizosphaerae]MBB3061759.1 hypothetical protein [Microbulbifer rhizosphaerae]